MILVDIDFPRQNVYDTGAASGWQLMPGAHLFIRDAGSMHGYWEVLDQVRDVVLVRRPREVPA